MKKVFTFTENQKALIWSTIVAPNNGTVEECEVFLEVCETYGLNPLLREIVFQKFETKYGPRVNHITTRDGYVKIAMRDPNYIRCMSSVVREGDTFEFDTVAGTVIHKFSSKRGNILGAWAIAEHKQRGRLPVFVDFEEHWRANAQSQGGKNKVWDTHPSSMIQKVAEVYALRRQFPLSGLITEEEIGGMQDLNEFPSVIPEGQILQPEENIKKEKIVLDPEPVNEPVMNESKPEIESSETGKTVEGEIVEEKTLNFLGVIPEEQKPLEQVTEKEEKQPVFEEPKQKEKQKNKPKKEQKQTEYKKVKVLKIVFEEHPASKKPFAKIVSQIEESVEFTLILAIGEEIIEKLDYITDGDECLMKLNYEKAHYLLEDVKPLTA